MPYKYISRLMTPEALQPKVVLVVSIFAMTMVFITDSLLPANIRLHMLYIFPMAAIALHCEKISAIVVGLVLSTLFQLITFYIDEVPASSLITDAAIAFLASWLTIYMARAVRENHLIVANMATTDPLTGLNNRRSFENIADLEIDKQKRYGGIFSIVVIDLDGFKNLNDSRGHHTGDAALQLLAKILRVHTRHSDSIARLGGDEFAILMPNTLASDCTSLCQQLAVGVADEMSLAGFAITTSIGCTAFEQPPESLLVALQKADSAMYAAKAGGKNCVVCV